MAIRFVAKRLATFPKLRNLSEEVKVCSPRALATAAAKAQDGAVQVDRKEGQPPASQSRRPRSFLPSLLSPFGQTTSLMQMMDTMDRLFENSLSTSIADPSWLLRSANSRIPWDVIEDDKCFKLRVDMPGMSKEEVKLAVEDGDLVVKAEHKAEDEEDNWSARSYGSCNFRIKLPENVDPNGIKAELKDGVLKVQAHKVEGKKERHEVQVE